MRLRARQTERTDFLQSFDNKQKIWRVLDLDMEVAPPTQLAPGWRVRSSWFELRSNFPPVTMYHGVMDGALSVFAHLEMQAVDVVFIDKQRLAKDNLRPTDLQIAQAADMYTLGFSRNLLLSLQRARIDR